MTIFLVKEKSEETKKQSQQHLKLFSCLLIINFLDDVEEI